VEGDNIALAAGQSITALRSNMNPLKLANEAHEMLRELHSHLGHSERCDYRTALLVQIDHRIHEIIADYERRGMEYDGPSS
jgi:hypothetical protein